MRSEGNQRRSKPREATRYVSYANVIFALLLAALPLTATAETLVIGNIHIRTEDVYAGDEDAGLLGIAANRLHIETHEDVIREFLLFQEGDPFEPERLAETERNLRKLPFLRKVTVTAREPRESRVDVDVVTQDSWSTEPGVSFGSSGGGTEAAVELTERNFLGQGWEVQYRLEQNPDRTSQSLRFRDPSLFGPYWKTELLYASNSDGTEQRFQLERPFFSTETRWSMQVSGSRVEREGTLYQGGFELLRYAASHDGLDLGYGWTLASSTHLAHRLSAGFSFQRDLFQDFDHGITDDRLPEDREYRYVWAQYDYLLSDYRKLQYVDRGELPQDFNLGTALSLRLGVSPAELGVTRTTGLVDVRLSRGFQLGTRSILLADFGYRSRIRATNRNAMSSLRVDHITRFDSAYPQTTVLSARLDLGSDLDRDFQLFADGESGLRGYRLHAFAGDERLVFNAEHRVFLGKELFNLVSPGLVAFVDLGTAAPEERGIRWGEMKLDAGLGLWLGLSRSGRNAVRIDLARAFDPDPLGRSPWVISVSSSQSF